MTSKTPITDKAAFPVIDADTDECTHAVPVRTSEQLETELAEARAEIESKSRLVEQMRDALELGCACCPNYHPERLAAVCGDCKIKAALSAAERMSK